MVYKVKIKTVLKRMHSLITYVSFGRHVLFAIYTKRHRVISKEKNLKFCETPTDCVDQLAQDMWG